MKIKSNCKMSRSDRRIFVIPVIRGLFVFSMHMEKINRKGNQFLSTRLDIPIFIEFY